MIALVGSHAPRLLPLVEGFSCLVFENDSSPDQIGAAPVSHIISFGYNKIFPDDFLGRFPNRVINIHISLLPWNRGSDPNFWSWFEGTPKGVSIHRVEKRLDGGPLLAQSEVNFGPHETLASSYRRLIREGVNLLDSTLVDFLEERLAPSQLEGTGSYHSRKDFLKYKFVLERGWDTPCSVVESWGLRLGKTLCPGG